MWLTAPVFAHVGFFFPPEIEKRRKGLGNVNRGKREHATFSGSFLAVRRPKREIESCMPCRHLPTALPAVRGAPLHICTHHLLFGFHLSSVH